jgi:hypothetical protein
MSETYTTIITEELLEDGRSVYRREHRHPYSFAVHQIMTPADAEADLLAERKHVFDLLDSLRPKLGREQANALDNAIVNHECAVRRDAAARIIAAVSWLVSEDEPSGFWIVPPVAGSADAQEGAAS